MRKNWTFVLAAAAFLVQTLFSTALSAEESSQQSIVIGHKNPDTDSVVAAIAYAHVLNARGIDAVAAAQGEVNPETKFVLDRFKINAPKVVKDAAHQNIYLVDFTDLEQAPENFDKANLKGIVDHHRLGNVMSDVPIEIMVMPYGCTNTIIKMAADYHKVDIPSDIAGAMLCAVLSDTVMFRSPTTTKFDIDAANELASIAKVDDIEALGMEMFKAKSDLNASAYELLTRDLKDYEIGGKKVSIAAMELVSLDMISDELRNSLKKELKNLKDKGCHTAVLMITDIVQGGSEIFVVSDEEDKVISALGAFKSEKMFVPGLMSRKKQIVPALVKALNP